MSHATIVNSLVRVSRRAMNPVVCNPAQDEPRGITRAPGNVNFLLFYPPSGGCLTLNERVSLRSTQKKPQPFAKIKLTEDLSRFSARSIFQRHKPYANSAMIPGGFFAHLLRHNENLPHPWARRNYRFSRAVQLGSPSPSFARLPTCARLETAKQKGTQVVCLSVFRTAPSLSRMDALRPRKDNLLFSHDNPANGGEMGYLVSFF